MNIIGNKKKIAIIGNGTAGCISLIQMHTYFNSEIEWIFDPNIPARSVGEGSILLFPTLLKDILDWKYEDLKSIDGTFKHGIRKINWEGSGDFVHSFDLCNSAIHFNARKFQSKILERYKNIFPKIKIIEKNIINYSNIDADNIIDCSGSPKDYTDYHHPSGIPINSAYITQCYWDIPKFDYTIAMARPHGWVFAIPLQNRCSIGYLYNKNFNSEEEIQEDIKNVFDYLNLTPSKETNSIKFKNYYKKINFTERVSYNGNASFFLEPLEATSLNTIIKTNIDYFTYLFHNVSLEQINQNYQHNLKSIEIMISLHYLAGSKFKTPFWEYAQEISLKFIENNYTQTFREIYSICKEYKKNNRIHMYPEHGKYDYGTWNVQSWNMNLKGLGLYNKIDKLLNI